MRISYIANDGMKFDSEEACKLHENDIAASRTSNSLFPNSRFYDPDLNEVELFRSDGEFNWAIEYMIIGTDADARAIKAECFKRYTFCPIYQPFHGRFYADENGDFFLL